MSEAGSNISTQTPYAQSDDLTFLQRLRSRNLLQYLWALSVGLGLLYVVTAQDPGGTVDVITQLWFFLFFVLVVELPSLVAVLYKQRKITSISGIHLAVLFLVLGFWLVVFDTFALERSIFGFRESLAFDTYRTMFKWAFALFSIRALWAIFGRHNVSHSAQVIQNTVSPKQVFRDSLLSLSAERQWLVEDLYRRSDRMRGRAQFILFAIVSLIIGGVVSIFLAGDLVSSDAQQQTRLEQMNTLLDNYESDWNAGATVLTGFASNKLSLVIEARILEREIQKKLALKSPQLVEIVRKYEIEVNPGGADGTIGPLADLARTKPDEDESRTDAVDPVVERQELLEARVGLVRAYAEVEKREELLSSRQTDIAEALKTLEKTLTGDVDKFLINATPKPADRSLLIASSFTRFGLLLVVVFLVQILVGVYRYSLRLSAFYAARADAIIAGGDRKSDLGGWGAEFLPMDIDFGRQPTTPAQYVVNVIDAYMAKRKKNGGPLEASDS